MTAVLAADLGGTKSRFALVDAALEVHAPSEVPTPDGRDALLQVIDAQFDRLRALAPPEGVTAIGVGVAGVVAADRRVLRRASNLPLTGFALADHLERRHQLPTRLINDGRASAWGEYLRGQARGADPLLVLFFGTGVGVGLIAGGRPYDGAGNAAGEVGHTVHIVDGLECSCGRRGCYEAYCGGGPMTRRAAAALGPPPAPSTAPWTVDGLVAQAAAGEVAAQAILADAERAAGALVASLCTLLDPAAVVLGGGVLRAWPALGRAVETATRAWCGAAVAGPDALRFVPSLAGSDAVLWGAARAARAGVTTDQV